MVERRIRNAQVTGSIPVNGSRLQIIMQNKEFIRQVFSDRGFFLAWIASVLAFLAIVVLCALEIRPSELQVPIRYSAFGITNIYRAQWYSELGFVGFSVLTLVLHTLIGIKLYKIKNRDFAIAFQWLATIVLSIAFLTFLAIFKVISIVE